MARLTMLGELEVIEDRSGRRDRRRHLLDAESFERRSAELGEQLVAGRILGEHPRVEPIGIVLRSESLGKLALVSFLIDHFLRGQVGQQLVDVGAVAPGREKLAGRQVEECDAGALVREVHGGEESVFLARQDVVAQRNARRDEFDDAPLDDFLRRFGVLELFADCHALPGADQFRKIGVDGMVREAGQFDVRGRAVGPARQRDAEYLAGLDRVLAERLVEVAHAEQQDRVAVHRLDAVVLLHQRRLDVFGFFCQVFKIIGSERKNSHLSSKKRSSKLIKYNFSVARVRAV